MHAFASVAGCQPDGQRVGERKAHMHLSRKGLPLSTTVADNLWCSMRLIERPSLNGLKVRA